MKIEAFITNHMLLGMFVETYCVLPYQDITNLNYVRRYNVLALMYDYTGGLVPGKEIEIELLMIGFIRILRTRQYLSDIQELSTVGHMRTWLEYMGIEYKEYKYQDYKDLVLG